MGRPDESDIEKAHKLGAGSLGATEYLRLKDVPIQIDKISRSDKYSAIKPAYIAKLCVQCGTCAKNCPIGLLSPDTGMYLSRAVKNQCIGCMACVSNCLKKARVVKANLIVKVVLNNTLRQASGERKEPLTIVG